MAKSKSTNTVSTTPAKEPHFIIKYFYDTRAELRRVSWPTQEETKNLTLIIVAVTVSMSVFLAILDYIFQSVTAQIISSSWLGVGLGVVLLAAGAAAFYYNNRESV